MGKKLFIVVNKTNQSYKFENKECANDEKEIQSCASATLESINLTPGQHGAGCDIPDCSDGEFFDKHHMEFIVQENNPENTPAFCFWYDDSKGQYYYTRSASFKDSAVIPGNITTDASKAAIFILNDGTLQISDIH